jgi:hypothetical protein
MVFVLKQRNTDMNEAKTFTYKMSGWLYREGIVFTRTIKGREVTFRTIRVIKTEANKNPNAAHPVLTVLCEEI